jgi:hypothetical protein
MPLGITMYDPRGHVATGVLVESVAHTDAEDA